MHTSHVNTELDSKLTLDKINCFVLPAFCQNTNK